MGFRGSKNLTPYAVQMAAETAAKAAVVHGLKTVEAMVKGPGSEEKQQLCTQACGLK